MVMSRKAKEKEANGAPMYLRLTHTHEYFTGTKA